MNLNKTLCAISVTGLVVLSSIAVGQQFQAEPTVRNPALREELLKRMEWDQETRKAVVDSAAKSFNGQPDALLVRDMRERNEANREWLAAYLAEHPSWPTHTEVGEDGAHAAWIIAHHADSDRIFQRNCLRLIQRQFELDAKEVSAVDLAYLKDRVRVASGMKQLYGTQVRIRNGNFEPVEIDQPEKLALRRANLGLQSMEDYLNRLRLNYARARGNTQNR